MSLALCLQVVSQAPQHLRSSEPQTSCGGFFASIYSVSFPSLRVYLLCKFSLTPCLSTLYVFLHSGMSSTSTGICEGGRRTLTHVSLGFPSPLIESVGMMACVVWLSPLEAIQRGTAGFVRHGPRSVTFMTGRLASWLIGCVTHVYTRDPLDQQATICL